MSKPWDETECVCEYMEGRCAACVDLLKAERDRLAGALRRIMDRCSLGPAAPPRGIIGEREILYNRCVEAAEIARAALKGTPNAKG